MLTGHEDPIVVGEWPACKWSGDNLVLYVSCTILLHCPRGEKRTAGCIRRSGNEVGEWHASRKPPSQILDERTPAAWEYKRLNGVLAEFWP